MENNKKQTAIEWFAERIQSDKIFSFERVLEKAKEMEKQQIIEAHGNKKVKSAGVSNCIETKTGERYYEETYNKIS
jgi:hypothetical protein